MFDEATSASFSRKSGKNLIKRWDNRKVFVGFLTEQIVYIHETFLQRLIKWIYTSWWRGWCKLRGISERWNPYCWYVLKVTSRIETFKKSNFDIESKAKFDYEYLKVFKFKWNFNQLWINWKFLWIGWLREKFSSDNRSVSRTAKVLYNFVIAAFLSHL